MALSCQLPRMKMVPGLITRKSSSVAYDSPHLDRQTKALEEQCPSDNAATGLLSLEAQERLKGVQVC